ncbi:MULTISPECIES: CpsD/CapB family tyrosine-protein kinase [unclassified Luteimonas]|uniref:CpsD/CapB family tyrosine-protein kinase n=1 Tax=unclassified Luteimonas TaxID=2629088 RepID=UPI001601F554|nr:MULTISPECIES: CpsD/CapB family tyrosine-protein kinase [unclassified Luteimonas]MBB1472344.1 polysaccharide biosynthesis protein [Luteimonas sp. MC1782]MBB6598939.1 polysaccharide biosynthesis protein [Luteimonas sp. MC1825]QOC89081.1 polysaccharide biosynthesis protein [Luteimonas sp. MC1825]
MSTASLIDPHPARDAAEPAADGAATRHEGSRHLARVQQAPLSPRALEERRLIHRQDSVRVQADAFRDLRTRLLNLRGNQNFITLVAPVAHGCGGSFVARNLALAFAFDEAKTALLVDCDALHPSHHMALAAGSDNRGLMDYLGGGIDDLAEIQYPTGIPRLQLIPNGSVREIAGEYFTSARARTMIDSLRSADPNRYIILDAPSALNSPDARILSDLADVVVLVAGYGKVTLDAIDKAAANFDPDKLAGIVFNDNH